MRYIILICIIHIYFTLFCNGENFQDNGDSYDLHLRKKRVIDKSEGGGRPVHISHVPYIVNILKNGMANCGGGILKAHIIITAAHCLNREDATYSVLSGSHYVNGGIRHTVEHKFLHPGYNPQRVSDDLAIAVISPPIVFGNSFNSPIEISNAYVPAGATVTFSGWGCHAFSHGRWIYPQELRSIQVPVLNHQECQNRLLHDVLLSEKEICTLDGYERKCGGTGDSGAPLVRNGKLIGVYAWSGGYGIYGLSPDVFMRLTYSGYRDWVYEIMARFPDDQGGASSSRRHRRIKRVIDLNSKGNRATPIASVPYIVNIMINGVPSCAGSILAPHIILTAAHCVEKKHVVYKILSGTNFAFFGTPHTIKVTIMHPGYEQNQTQDDLAILVIDPPINFNTSVNRPIQLNLAYVPPNVPVTFSGWGCHIIQNTRNLYPDNLQSTDLPVLSNSNCEKALAHVARITEKDICTLDKTERKNTCQGDSGGPLVRNRKLIGVYAWFGGYNNNKLTPSVFMRLSHPTYREWILATMEEYRQP